MKNDSSLQFAIIRHVIVQVKRHLGQITWFLMTVITGVVDTVVLFTCKQMHNNVPNTPKDDKIHA